MSVLGANPLLLGGDDGDQVLPIQRSVRLRSSNSAYFSRTPASAGNRTTWTWSAWVKRGKIDSGTTQYFLLSNNSASNDTGSTFMYFFQDGLRITGFNTSWRQTTQLFRDPSAWYHIVVVWDTTNATALDRVRIYVNGLQVTAFSTTNNPTQNSTGGINAATATYIGADVYFGPANHFDGYLAEVNFIDGQALTPTSFGFFSSTTGVWQPKRYIGTFGTNGFYLNFEDNSAVTTSSNVGIGKDSSGGGKFWTSNGINVSAYTGTPSNNVLYDSMIDTPTPYSDGGNNRGNYPTLQVNASLGNGAYTEANLGFKSGVTGQWRGAHASMFMPSGKFYFEATIQALSGNNFFMIGACGIQTTNTLYANLTGQVANGWGVQCNGSTGGAKYNNNGIVNVSNASFASWVVNDVLQCAVDVTNGRIWFGKNNVWLEGVPSAGTGASYTNLTGAIAPSVSVYGSGVDKLAVNFGQRPFSYTPPSGFVAVNSFNLPDSTITNGANHFAATTYTGTGSALSVSNTVNGNSFQPDFVWIKGRSGSTDHALYDSVRGATLDLASNSTALETTQINGLTAFGLSGFTVGSLAKVNTNTATYVGWQWKASITTTNISIGSVSSGVPSIASTVNTNPSAGFSIVTWTGTNASGTVGHGLGIAPKMIIYKRRSSGADNWVVYHSSISNSQNGGIYLNLTNAWNSDSTLWNNAAPTQSVFSVGTYGSASSVTMVAYCFAEIDGYSKFGSYTGTGAADGMFIYLGFRPRFIMFKSLVAGNNWLMFDTTRNTYNLTDNKVAANAPNNENAVAISSISENNLDILSNGFKLRTINAQNNGSTATIIYAAFAENPFKHSLAR